MNYKPRGIKNIASPEVQEDIHHLYIKIRDIAKDALSEEIILKDAKKEISDLLENIKQLKKEEK
jgi:hypothetical protein